MRRNSGSQARWVVQGSSLGTAGSVAPLPDACCESAWASRPRACAFRRPILARKALASRSARASRGLLRLPFWLFSDEFISKTGSALRSIAQPWASRCRDAAVLAKTGSLCQFPRRSPFGTDPADSCCRSSVVEHSIGNGEVDSSILSGSTSPLQPAGLGQVGRRMFPARNKGRQTPETTARYT